MYNSRDNVQKYKKEKLLVALSFCHKAHIISLLFFAIQLTTHKCTCRHELLARQLIIWEIKIVGDILHLFDIITIIAASDKLSSMNFLMPKRYDVSRYYI